MRIGPRAGADQEVSFQPIRPRRGGGLYVFSYGYTTGTDERGRFAFDRVIPGPGTVSRVIITEFPAAASSTRRAGRSPSRSSRARRSR